MSITFTVTLASHIGTWIASIAPLLTTLKVLLHTSLVMNILSKTLVCIGQPQSAKIDGSIYLSVLRAHTLKVLKASRLIQYSVY